MSLSMNVVYVFSVFVIFKNNQIKKKNNLHTYQVDFIDQIENYIGLNIEQTISMIVCQIHNVQGKIKLNLSVMHMTMCESVSDEFEIVHVLYYCIHISCRTMVFPSQSK